MTPPAISRLGKPLGKRVLVCVEGETEENYLLALRAHWNIQREQLIFAPNKATDPANLVAALIAHRNKLKRARGFDEEYGDTAWLVMDVDEHKEHNLGAFNRAIELAGRNGIRLALSNPDFELWIVHHKLDHARPMNRVQMLALAREQFADYHKGYPIGLATRNLIPHLAGARACSQRLAGINSQPVYAAERFRNPSTYFFELVAELETLKR